MDVERQLPSGTVTFLFTDVEGSTALLHELGDERYAEALGTHRRVIRDAATEHGGVEVDTQGDAFLFAFPTAPGAIAAAAALTERLAGGGRIRVRAGVHTGSPLLTGEGYVGEDLHRAARIAAAGHGGQVLVSSSTASLVATELRDLGPHRFKDLTTPERVYQLGTDDFPALKSLYRSTLPVPATPFVGREQELSSVTDLLGNPELRLVTLVGPGGIGKTRLAIEAASAVSESFPDGVFWVPFAPLQDPGLALITTADTLGVKEQPGTEPLEPLVAALAGKRLLVVLDNAEHLLPRVADDVAALTAALPTLTCVVTSRERLRVAGEHVYAVSTLAPHDGEALLLARARALDPSYPASERIRELCDRLDNLPLAIELAAARTGLLTLDQLLERLGTRLDLLKGGRDSDPRQQTLRTTIAWSHDLLSPEEKRVFAELSVFSGCTIEAAEEVCESDLETLQSLLDKSLLRRREETGGARLWMLETIRAFAAEQLGHAATVAGRHLAYYLALAEEVAERGEDGDYESERLEPERDNLRAALAHALAEQPESALHLAGALGRYWNRTGHFREGREQLLAALAGAPQAPSSARCVALYYAGNLALEDGALRDAETLAEEALELARRDGDGRHEGRALCVLGTLDAYRGDLSSAATRLEESLSKATASSDSFGRWVALVNLADVTAASGDHARAIAVGREVAAAARARGSDGVLASALSSVGRHLAEAGDVDEARHALEEALAVTRARGLLSLRVQVLANLGRLESTAQPETAARHFIEVLALAGETDVPRETLSSLEGLAALTLGTGTASTATKLLAAAAARREELGMTRTSDEQATFDAATADARDALGEPAFTAAWAEGSELALAAAVKVALAHR
jgi:predicted ATPase/class 3 adenylate cyclase